MAILVRGGQNADLTGETALNLRPRFKEERAARLTGGSSTYDAACNPVSLKVTEFARVIDVDFSERRLVQVDVVDAPDDGFDW